MEFVGLDKMSLLDYEDKVACVVFSKICNFRCPFCHNGNLITDQNVPIIPWNTIVEYLNSRKGLIDAVVFTGGEVTLFPDLDKKMAEVKKMGFLVKLDTNGTEPHLLKKYINEGLVDYVAMDIKNAPSKYALTCGVPHVDIEKIKESVDFLINGNVDYEFRTTLVEELHGEADFDEMGNFIKGAKRLFLQKFVDREGVFVKCLHEVEEKDASKIAEVLRKYISKVELRGY